MLLFVNVVCFCIVGEMDSFCESVNVRFIVGISVFSVFFGDVSFVYIVCNGIDLCSYVV